MGDLADPVTGEAGHHDARDVQATGDRVADVLAPAGWPFARTGTIRSIRRQCESIAVKNRCTAAVPAVFEREGGIRTQASVGQQRDERVDLVFGERRDEPVEQCTLLRTAGRGGCGESGERAASIVARARLSALVTASSVSPSKLGGLTRAVAEHVTQQQDGPLVRRQQLDSGDERERDRLAGLVIGPRARAPESAAPPARRDMAATTAPRPRRVGSGGGTGNGAAATGRRADERNRLRHRLVAMR